MRIASSLCGSVLIAFLALVACGGGGGEAGDDTSPAEGKRGRKEKPVSEQGKEWSGWRWKGRRQDCFFLVKNECHSSFEEACKAAGCQKSDCEHDESAPAKVTCEK